MTHRRGSIAVVLAIVLVVTIAIAALVVDLGYARLVQAQLQAAADASSLAGVSELNGTDEGMDQARVTAVEVAAMNLAHGEAVVLDPNADNSADGEVVLGTWDGGVFTPSTAADEVNAVSVLARRPDLVPLLSAVAFQRQELGAGALSIATIQGELGAGEVPYYLPFGLPDCMWDEYTGEQLMDMTFVLNPAGEDTTGWATLGGHPNTSWLNEHLAEVLPCMWEWYDTGEVSQACAEGSVSDTMGMATGENTSALRTLADAVSAGVPLDTAVWGDLPDQAGCSAVDEGSYGNAVVGPIPVFNASPDYCDGGGSWNEEASVDGFVWAAIYDVCWKGAAQKKNVFLKIDMDSKYEIGTGWGGGDYGIVSVGPGVVVR
jgi:hypothetical protein